MAVSNGLQGGVATAERLEGGGGLALLDLLGAKLVATSLCVGAGLVGGTFAPSLFFGAVLGVAYQSLAGSGLASLAEAIAAYQTSIGVEVGSWGVIPQLGVADAPAYAMVGAAATLASVFRAPLTASVLIFELTRGYDLVLPLLAAAGTGPLVVEFATRAYKRRPRSAEEEAAVSTKEAVVKIATTPSSAARLVEPAVECAALELAPATVEPEDCVLEAPPPFVVLPDTCDTDNAIMCEKPEPGPEAGEQD